ncbi:MAG: BTAD domain-containing putative transcriptional regulator [Acidimicrobiales bacterium]
MDGYLLRMFGGFDVVSDGTVVELPPEAQRLVAFLALREKPVQRSFVAGSLWLDSTEDRARANLRSVLSRVRRVLPGLVDADFQTLRLGRNVRSDVESLTTRAEALWGMAGDPDLDLNHRPFTRELLPGWYEDWVVVERERLRQLCLHSLESLAEVLRTRHMFGAAIQALLASVALDSLRESPRRQLVEVHLAEGNVSEALRQYQDFAEVLDRELGLAPSSALWDLLEPTGIGRLPSLAGFNPIRRT